MLRSIQWFFLLGLAFIFISNVGCGGVLRGMAGMRNTAACVRMEQMCGEASEFRKKYYKADVEERTEMEPKLRGLDQACSDSMSLCNESQTLGKRGIEDGTK